MLERTQYYGSYRDNDDYCEAYLSKERWEKLQQIKSNNKRVKVYYPDRFYLFSRLIIDSNCGNKLAGHCFPRKNKDLYYYNCNKARISKQCISNPLVNEEWLENYLLDNLNSYLDEYYNALEKEYGEDKIQYKDNSKKIAQIKEQLRRTTISFNKGRMDEDEYDKEYTSLEKQLLKLQSEPKKKDVRHLKELTSLDWQSMYKSLNKHDRQSWWRNVIDTITLDPLNYKKGKEYIQIKFVD